VKRDDIEDWDEVPIICALCASVDCAHTKDPNAAGELWGVLVEEIITVMERFRVVAASRDDAEAAALEYWVPEPHEGEAESSAYAVRLRRRA
jgi:hypothetical protein